MISLFFKTFFYNPLYNLLLFLTFINPTKDIGVSIITLTLIIKSVLLPISNKSNNLQKKVKEIDPEIKEIRNKYKDKEEQAEKLINLYKKHKINPFSGIFLLFIQMPIILTLFYLFYKGFEYQSEIIYPFLSNLPVKDFSIFFLGQLNINEPLLIFAILVGLTQLIQANLLLPTPKKPKKRSLDFKDNFSQTMSIQARYIMPLFFILIASKLPIAVCLYWLTSNLFTIIYELFFKKKIII